DTLIMSGNWYLLVSDDGGASFSRIDPFQVMADVDGGFCCDQVVAYEPSRDLAFVVMITVPSPTTRRNTLRLLVIRGRPTGPPVVFAYNIRPEILGFPADHWLDFPKLVTGRNHAYLTVNVFTPIACELAETECTFTRSALLR